MKAETGSASYGIDFEYTDSTKRRWYRRIRFPLIPVYDTRPADEWNASAFSFSWLNLRIWSLNSFAFAAEFHAEEIGLFLRFQLPYLNIYVWLLPLPERFAHRLSRSPIKRGSNGKSVSDRQRASRHC